MTTQKELNCFALMQAIEVQMGFVVVACSTLLAIRSICIYQDFERKVVACLVTVLTLALLATWMIGARDVVTKWVPQAGPAWTEGACVPTSLPQRYSVKYVVTIAFDSIVMVLTILGIMRMNSSSRIGAVLIRQGVQYFLVTLLSNSIVAGLTLANLNPIMSLVAAIPSSTICVMCATRLFVNLTEEAKPKEGGVYLFSTSSSRSEKIARFFTKSRDTPAGQTSTYGHFPVNALSYEQRNVLPHQAPRKSFGMVSRSSDIEAQMSRTSLCIQITEKQTITQEPMPAHLNGMLLPHTSRKQ